MKKTMMKAVDKKCLMMNHEKPSFPKDA